VTYQFVPAYYGGSGSDPGNRGWTHSVVLQHAPSDWETLEVWEGENLDGPRGLRIARVMLRHLLGAEPPEHLVLALVYWPGHDLSRIEVPELRAWVDLNMAEQIKLL
jgi:hypothetical protein